MVLLEEFQSFLYRSGARQVGERYYGVWNGFPFSAHVDREREPGAVTLAFHLAASLENGAFRFLRKSLPKGCRLMAAANCSYRLALNGGRLRKAEETLSQVVDQVTRQLREAGITPSDVCPVCHSSECDAYADISGGYTAVHRACVENLAEATRTKAETSLRSGSYATGFLGALVGGLAACIPNVAAYFAGWLVGYLYALVPLGAYFGYKLFRGRMDSGAFLCTCISSVIQLFAMEQIIFYFMVHQVWDIWPSILDTIALYWSVMTLGQAFADMGMSVVFMALGLWISWGIIRKNAFTDLGAANAVRSTLSVKQLDGDQLY